MQGLKETLDEAGEKFMAMDNQITELQALVEALKSQKVSELVAYFREMAKSVLTFSLGYGVELAGFVLKITNKLGVFLRSTLAMNQCARVDQYLQLVDAIFKNARKANVLEGAVT